MNPRLMDWCPNCHANNGEMIMDTWYNEEDGEIEVLLECPNCEHQHHATIALKDFTDLGVMSER